MAEASNETALTVERVFREYAPRVYHLARRMLGNEADAQDVAARRCSSRSCASSTRSGAKRLFQLGCIEVTVKHRSPGLFAGSEAQAA